MVKKTNYTCFTPVQRGVTECHHVGAGAPGVQSKGKGGHKGEGCPRISVRTALKSAGSLFGLFDAGGSDSVSKRPAGATPRAVCHQMDRRIPTAPRVAASTRGRTWINSVRVKWHYNLATELSSVAFGGGWIKQGASSRNASSLKAEVNTS